MIFLAVTQKNNTYLSGGVQSTHMVHVSLGEDAMATAASKEEADWDLLLENLQHFVVLVDKRSRVGWHPVSYVEPLTMVFRSHEELGRAMKWLEANGYEVFQETDTAFENYRLTVLPNHSY